MTENRFIFSILAEKKIMLSPARIVFMVKCISDPNDRKTIIAFLLMRKQILTNEASEKIFYEHNECK